MAHDDTQIWVKIKTRGRILGKAKKKETYDDYINRAIDALEGE
jgi:hypothetical protein